MWTSLLVSEPLSKLSALSERLFLPLLLAVMHEELRWRVPFQSMEVLWSVILDFVFIVGALDFVVFCWHFKMTLFKLSQWFILCMAQVQFDPL
mmetsp:Transcript_13735/g.19065  ORF Transcript_13735/g.19065 Transcript_13735/m.19065 type:complete len:93 (-) Transcript_13735:1285-1563(-)